MTGQPKTRAERRAAAAPSYIDPWAEPDRGGAISTFTPETAALICQRLIGGESLRGICRDPAMPSKATVLVWLLAHPEFQAQYARARELSADANADDVDDLSQLVAQGKLDPQAALVAINGIKWTAGQKQPKKYGVKRHEHGGPGGAPIPVKLGSLTDAQLGELARRLGADQEPDGSGEAGAGPAQD